MSKVTISGTGQIGSAVAETATFGPVHLEVSDRAAATAFWRDDVGLVLREDGETVALGSAQDTLVVLHPVASAPVARGHAGLYHLAVHLPSEAEFARVLLRMIRRRVPIAPTDHTMSKAIYLEDPDGMTVEITLETPERLREFVVDDRGMVAIDAQGRVRGGSERLDVHEVLDTLEDDDSDRPVPVGTRIGHVHLYVGDLQAAYDFYERLGFEGNPFAQRLGFADLGAGGRFRHRIAVNVWQGVGVPQAPAGTARMRHYGIRFGSQARLRQALDLLGEAAQPAVDGYRTHDPSGNAILLSADGA